MKRARRLALEVIERVIADAFMVNLGLLTAFTLRFLSFFVLGGGEGEVTAQAYSSIFRYYVRSYLGFSWLLTLLSLAVFYFSGFYTYGRTYVGRYKALVIAQAVSIAYLLFGFLVYFVEGFAVFPRSVLILGWLLTLILVGGLRVWATLWRATVWTEAKIFGHPKKTQIRSVLVIGGAGYIGSVLVRRLLAQGYSVTVLDALLYGGDSIADLEGRPGFSLVEGDFRNVEVVVQALQFADAVVHLGALVGDPACALDERLTVEVNLAATRMIAEAARGFGVQRFIFASTCSVYGAANHMLDERSALNPVSLYARTKIESERVLLGLNDGSFEPVVLRFATIHGLSPRPRFDLVVNLLAARAVCEKSITIFGGEQWRPFVHVKDAVEAIVKCLQAPPYAVAGQVFNVGSNDQNHQIARLGELMKELIPDVQIRQKEDDVDVRNYRVSFSKISQRLGFVAHHTVRDGILEIKAAVADGRISDYRDARYSNYRTLAEESSVALMRRTRITMLYAGGAQDVESSIAPATGPAGAQYAERT